MKSKAQLDDFQLKVLSLAGLLAPQATGKYVANAFLTPRQFKRPDWEQALLSKGSPVELKSGRKAWRWGNSERRVFLVHGWEGRGTQLGAFIEPLVNSGYQVIAWDGPAHGQSPGKQTHLVEFANSLKDDISHLGNFEAVVGHSMGGAALLLATQRGLKALKYVLISSPSQWGLTLKNVATKLKLRDASYQAALQTIESQVGEPMDRFDVQQWGLQELNPVFIVHDESDRDVPASEYARLREALPKAQTRLYQGLGHRRILKNPDVIRDVLKFISEPLNA